MADKKISQLTELTTGIDGADLTVLVDDPAGSPETKKMTWQNVLSNLPAAASSITLNTTGNSGITLGLGGTAGVTIDASNVTTTGLLVLDQAGAGDASIQFLLNGGQAFTVGIDNSTTGDHFVISDNAGLGTNDRLVIDENGDVAIGLSVPLDDFHISRASADCHLRLTGNVVRLRFDEDDTTDENWQFLHNAGALRLQSANDAFSSVVDQLYVNTSGVGIGSTLPAARLHVADGLTASSWTTNGIGLRIDAETYTDSSTAGSGTAATNHIHAVATPTLAASNASVTTTDAATLYIAAEPTAGTNMTITNAYALIVDSGNVRFDGNVGLGSGNVPSTNLNVYESNTDTAAAVLIEQASTGDAALSFLLTGGQQMIMGIDNNDSDKFKITDNSAFDTNDRVIIDTSGNVTVGDDAGTQTNLAVYESNTDTAAAILIEQGSTGDAALSFLLTGGQQWTMGIDNTVNDDFKISDSSALGTTDRLHITAAGNLNFYPADSQVVRTYVDNAINTAQFRVEQDGAGDAVMQFLLTGGESFVMGIDNSSSDNFRIADGTDLGTDTRFQITGGGQVDLFPADTRSARVYSNGTNTTSPQLMVEQDGSGDAHQSFLLTGGQQWTLGIDNSSTNDDFVISDGNDLNTNPRITIDGSSGDIGFGVAPSDDYHFAKSSGVCNVRITGNQLRLRFDEEDTSNQNYQILYDAGRFRFQQANDAFSSVTDVLSLEQSGEVRLTSGGSVWLARNTETSITASATNTSAGGTALTSEVNVVDTAGADHAVTLPSAAVGRQIWVGNASGNTIHCWAATGDTIGSAANSFLTLNDTVGIMLVAVDTTRWMYLSGSGGISAI